MAGVFTQLHMQRLEAKRHVGLVLQKRPGSISLQKRDPDTREFVDFLTIDKSFYPFFTEDADGRSLPPDVRYELQIGELMITDEDAKQVGAIQHGSQRYRVVRGDQAEPGIVPPTGPQCYWRFHITPWEEVL